MEEDGFNGDTCVAYFWCDYTKYYHAFPIKNYKQETLLPLFKSIMAFMKKFDARGICIWHIDKEQGVGIKIKNFIQLNGGIIKQLTLYTLD